MQLCCCYGSAYLGYNASRPLEIKIVGVVDVT